MATKVSIGWLQDKNGDKFAPKTLLSQVQTLDGILLEDKLRAEFDSMKEEILDSIGSVSVETDIELSAESSNPVANWVLANEFDEITECLDTHEHSADKILMTDSEGNYIESQDGTGTAIAGTLEEFVGWVDRNFISIYEYLNGTEILENINDIVSNHNSSTTAHSDIRASIDELETELKDKASSTHSHSMSDITNIDNYVFITTDDIDAICGNAILNAEEVAF